MFTIVSTFHNFDSPTPIGRTEQDYLVEWRKLLARRKNHTSVIECDVLRKHIMLQFSNGNESPHLFLVKGLCGQIGGTEFSITKF